jgi:predicted HTH domain antitoxin
MNSETIYFEVSQDILDTLKVGSDELLQRMRLLTAIAYFQEKKLSLGKAAKLAGMNRLDFMDILSQKGIVIFDYDESELNTELSGINHLRVDNDDYQ